jgi:hypothetical protein
MPNLPISQLDRASYPIGIVNDPRSRSTVSHSLGNNGSREKFISTAGGTITRFDNREHPHAKGYVGMDYPSLYQVGLPRWDFL